MEGSGRRHAGDGLTGCQRTSVGMTVDLGQSSAGRSAVRVQVSRRVGEGDDKVDRATI